MRKKQNDRRPTPQARQVSARTNESSATRTAGALLEGRHDAVSPGGLMDLQRTAGNTAVAHMIDRAPVVSRRTAMVGSASPAASAPAASHHRVDDENAWANLTAPGLVLFYISSDDQFVDGKFTVPHTTASFTVHFVNSHRGDTLELLRKAIRKQHDRAGVLREMLRSMKGEQVYIDEVRQVLTLEYKQDVKGMSLNDTEGLELEMSTRGVILESIAEFGYQCQNQKSAIRKEMAEDAEFFSFVLEIVFSFVPVAGKAIGKGLGKLAEQGLKPETYKKLEHAVEFAEKVGAEQAVEGTLKGAQRAIKSARPSNESEGEAFIESLQKQARKAAEGSLGTLNRMTFNELLHTASEFAEKMDTYGDQLRETWEMYRKSAAHIGQSQYWEYGRRGATLGGDTQAAWIQTMSGKRLGLITYEISPYGSTYGKHLGPPVWLDWIPQETQAVTIEKSKQKYGEPIELSEGEYKLPDEYRARFSEYKLPWQRE